MAGLMCCDQNGLCLKCKGDMNPLLSGSYTAVIRLASQLKGFEGNTSSVMVTIETSNYTEVVKQYDGHTVVMKSPSASSNFSVDSKLLGDVHRKEDVRSNEHLTEEVETNGIE
jgi:hypothetical protein